MVGPGSQRNKPHKSRPGRSAREKHRQARDAPGVAAKGAAARGAQGKAERLNAAKQQRDKKRAELLQQRRVVGPPRVVAVLPLSAAVDAERLFAGLLQSCQAPQQPAAARPPSSSSGMEVEAAADGGSVPLAKLAMQTVAVAERRRLSFTFLPPPEDRSDPLAVVDLGRAADVLVLAVPGEEGYDAIDEEGLMALSVLRAMGLPSFVGAVQLGAGGGSGEGASAGLKARSAAKKRGAAVLQAQLPGDYKVLLAEGAVDMQQLVRHLADAAPSPPLWRQQRPSVLLEAAEFSPAEADPSSGTLLLRGYVRSLGLSVNQALHIPLAGDFQLEQLDVLDPPTADQASAGRAEQQAEAMQEGGRTLVPDPQLQEALQRENVPDPLAGEQTWPTEEELMEAEATNKAKRKRRLPPGTSDYQAAWILDDEGLSDDEDESGSEDGRAQRMSDDDEDVSLTELGDGMDTATVAGTEFGMEDDEDPSALADMLEDIKARRRAAEDDALFPDEVEVPPDMPARQRFDKYRGLKSFRTSRWDPKESLPLEYARVFAFERPRRTEKRAKELAQQVGSLGDARGVPAGTYVQLHVRAVPAEAAARVCDRVAASTSAAAAPLVAFGLLQHECKLSVLNFGLRAAAGAEEEPVANKEPLLFVTGLRGFVARPIYSSDEHGADKHKMERFLHEGRPAVASVYGPISYGPLPVLAFRASSSGGPPHLVATGSLRSCDPDRVVLKKIVLSGFPVKVHKHKAVVRFMFHNPDDVRWFRPVELWTKQGRRGRISEPVGTHGAMKCIFDSALRQQDAVCISLYKRSFPKWPESMSFCAA